MCVYVYCACMYAVHMCVNMCAMVYVCQKDREELWRVSSLLPLTDFQGLNSNHLAYVANIFSHWTILLTLAIKIIILFIMFAVQQINPRVLYILGKTLHHWAIFLVLFYSSVTCYKWLMGLSIGILGVAVERNDFSLCLFLFIGFHTYFLVVSGLSSHSADKGGFHCQARWWHSEISLSMPLQSPRFASKADSICLVLCSLAKIGGKSCHLFCNYPDG